MAEKEKLFEVLMVPQDGQPTTFEDADGNERNLFRSVSVMAESEEAAKEIVQELEMRKDDPDRYVIKGVSEA